MRIKRSFFALTAISALIATGCGSGTEATNTNTAAATSVEITTAQPTLAQIPTYIEATGNLASDAQSDVAPAVGGKIVEVNFDIGSYVQQGAVLVRLDARDANIRL